MLDATTALLSFPFFISHKLSNVLIAIITKCLSSFSGKIPLIHPIDQQRLLKFSKENSVPSNYLSNLLTIIYLVFS